MQDRSMFLDVATAMSRPNWRAAALVAAIVILGLLIGSIRHMRSIGPRLKPRQLPLVRDVQGLVLGNDPPSANLVNSRLQYVDFQEALGLLHMSLESPNARKAILDCCGNVIEANDGWLKFARDHQAMGQSTIPTLLTADKLQLPPDELASVTILASVIAVIDGVREKYRASYRAPELDFERVYEFSAARIEAHGTTHILVSHEDVTDAREAVVEVRRLSKHVTEIEEDERQRIAGELHDVTGQHLIAISLNLMNLRREMKASSKADRLIGDIERSAEEAQQEIRLLSYLLYPPQLEQEGVKETIEHYVDGFARRAGLKVMLNVAPETDALPLELQRSVLRIIQEAMANVHRHARATSVMLKLTTDHNSLNLEVRDDGQGIQQSGTGSPASGLGVGIPGMKARVGQFNGVLRIESSGKGTVLRVRIPIASVWPIPDRKPVSVRALH